MALNSNISRPIAAFLIAFVCLNAAGAACVAYCQAILDEQIETARQVEAGHCSPPSVDAENPSPFLADTSIACCPMVLGVVGGPVEKRAASFDRPALPVSPARNIARPIAFSDQRQFVTPAYRGPPLDRRRDRILHCVIRI